MMRFDNGMLMLIVSSFSLRHLGDPQGAPYYTYAQSGVGVHYTQ